MSSNDAPSFIVALELTQGFVDANPDIFDGLMKAGIQLVSGQDVPVFRFRAPKPINGLVTLAPGCTLRDDEPDPSNDASLQPLPNKLLARLRATAERDETEDMGQDDNECYQPSSDEQGAFNACQDEPPRAEHYHDESQPETNVAPPKREKRAISLGELLESEDLDDTAICAPLGIAFSDRPMVIAGGWGTAKTWVMIWLALQFATGRPLFDNPAWPIERPLRVIIFDYELNRKVYKKRLRELCTTMGIDYRTIRDSIYYYERPKFFLTDANAVDRFLAESKGFDVILGDALRGAAPDADENKSEFRNNLDKLNDLATAANKFVCFLHHAGKGEESKFRGTSGIGDAVGVMFTVTNDKDDKRAPKKLHHEKLGTMGDDFVDDFFIQLKRDGEDEKGPMRIKFMTEEQAEEQAEERADQMSKDEFVDRMKKILLVIRSKLGISRNELGKIVRGNKPKRDKIIDWLLDKGHIENKGNGKRHKYELTSAGQEWLDKGSRHAARTPGPNAPTTPNAPPSSPDNAPPPFDTTDESTEAPEAP